MSSKKQKSTVAVLALCMVLSLSFAAVAYLSQSSGWLKNMFGVDSQKDPNIEEVFDGIEKKNVSVSVGNPDYAVYVRAMIVVTWKNKDGNVLAQKPVADTDYSIELNVGDGKPWFVYTDDFYYYRNQIHEGSTDQLILSCKRLKDAPEAGYTLHVEIIAQTIQALGRTDTDNKPAVTDAWGVTVNPDGTLSGGTP